jgi:hypothetical protein
MRGGLVVIWLTKWFSGYLASGLIKIYGRLSDQSRPYRLRKRQKVMKDRPGFVESLRNSIF